MLQIKSGPKNQNPRDWRSWIPFWIFGGILLLFAFAKGAESNTDQGDKIDEWLFVAAVLWFAIPICIGLCVWLSRTWRVAFDQETPVQLQRAIVAVQTEAQQVLGRRLTEDEIVEWIGARRHHARVNLTVAGGVVALHSFLDHR